VLKAKYNNPLIPFVSYCFFVFAFSGMMLLKQKEHKIKKASFAFWPMIHAFTGNYSANDISIQIRMREISTSPITASIIKSISKFLRAVFLPSESKVSKTATA
jgi:archaellum biogenesis protein FlaJ (TadC family)